MGSGGVSIQQGRCGRGITIGITIGITAGIDVATGDGSGCLTV